MTIIISVLDGHQTPQTRRTKTGIRYYQYGYAHLGGAFPVQIEMSIQSPSDSFPVGDYQLSPKTFRVNQYGRLELSPWELHLDPVKQPITLSKAG